MLKIKYSYLQLFLCISVIFLKKAMVQYAVFKSVLLYSLKVYPSV